MRTKSGLVSSSKMMKTVVVSVHGYNTHPKYKKRYRTTKKFYAHDEQGLCKEGDLVTISECRPLSKLKRWQVIEINGKTATAAQPSTLNPQPSTLNPQP